MIQTIVNEDLSPFCSSFFRTVGGGRQPKAHQQISCELPSVLLGAELERMTEACNLILQDGTCKQKHAHVNLAHVNY